MPLIERELFLLSLQKQFENVAEGEGHCILLSGEAGIGKSALVKAFCKKQAEECSIYQGACDSLFTPRALAPLYDVLWQVNKDRWPIPPFNEERSELFASFFQELRAKKEKLLLVFEDIHWADEGTLDFIKFFVRRIDQLPCLFILTYRDDELYSRHPLRNVLGQLSADSFTKMILTPLSKNAVVEMANQKGYNGEDVYSISGGNPFYVNEILASYSPGVPDNIKDSILSVYERQEEGTKNAWQIFSVIPEGLEVERFGKLKACQDDAINHCFSMSVLMVQNDKVVFKHELYRRTIEESLTPFKRIQLNKLMLDLFLESFEEKGEIERILHYAKNANEKQLVVKYATLAAAKAASNGAHQEASKLYLTAIQNSDGITTGQLVGFYEAYAYECYLSNQVKEAIAYTEKVLKIHTDNSEIEKMAADLCFLSRLWWIDGNGKNAGQFVLQAVELMKERENSTAKATAFSTLAEIKMLSGEAVESQKWAEETISIAKELNNEEVQLNARSNISALQLLHASSSQNAVSLAEQILETALRIGQQDQVARTYANLGTVFVRRRDYEPAIKMLGNGIRYCEERGLNFWAAYMLSWKARMDLERGNWEEAWNMADVLLKNENQPAVVKITALLVLSRKMMRRGKDALPLLVEAKARAFETGEAQRIYPVIIGCLEFEWLTGKSIIEKKEIDKITLLSQANELAIEKSEFFFWMEKAGREVDLSHESSAAYDTGSHSSILKAAGFWEKAGCPFDQAMILFEGKEDEKIQALSIIQGLGAMAVYEKMKQEMRNQGIRNIPRGIRNSTRSNAAFLTGREIDVLKLLKEELHNKEIAAQLYISAKTVDHHISSILFKLDANSRSKAVTEAVRMGIIK